MNKIYCFSNAGGGDGPAIALGSDGTVLGSHLCSNETFVPGDLGVTKGSRPDRHEGYKKHFPDGYEMEFIPADELDGHEGLQEAIRLNHLQGDGR